MAKIINFPGKTAFPSEVKKLKEISDHIDEIIIGALSEETVDPKELVALLAHRFGSLLGHMEEKRKLWKICEKIIWEQSGIKK